MEKGDPRRELIVVEAELNALGINKAGLGCAGGNGGNLLRARRAQPRATAFDDIAAKGYTS
jgi:hypothetical protein